MTQTILLGFDGSPDAIAAAAWAAREAAHHGATLRILHTYDWPYLDRLDHLAKDALESDARAVAELGRATAVEAAPGIDVETTVTIGQPAPALAAAARDCDLLVLGRRGHKPLHHILLGSVATKCLHQVTCPVVIIVDPDAHHDD